MTVLCQIDSYDGVEEDEPTSNDITPLKVLVLVVEGNVALRILGLAHDLDCPSLCLADVEDEMGRGLSYGHDAQTDGDSYVSGLFSALHVLVLFQEVGQSCPLFELVRVSWIVSA